MLLSNSLLSPLIFAAAGLALTAIPKAALFDAPVHIVARAAPFSVVTIEAATKIDGNRYHSWASFRTNHEGVVDVARSAPTAGSYTSSDAMGLFWSMTPFGPSVFSTPTLEPMLVSLTVNAGTRHAKVTLTRLRTAPDVIRQPIQNAPFVGTLFQHQSGPPRAIVVVLGGSEGGMDENRAAIIAAHGFDTVALAYFGMPSLPTELANIPLEYVQGALEWVHRQPNLTRLPILFEGDSKGSELALLVASRDPMVRGVVAFAPSSQLFEGFSTRDGRQRASWTIRGEPVAFANNPIPPAVKAAIRKQRGAHQPVAFRNQYAALATPAQDASTINVENIRGPLLLVAGADDQLWPSDVFSQRIIVHRKTHGVAYRDETLLYANAGHQIDVPYMPTTGLSVFDERSFLLALGGTPAGYAHADADMWPKVIRFMERAATDASSDMRADYSMR